MESMNSGSWLVTVGGGPCPVCGLDGDVAFVPGRWARLRGWLVNGQPLPPRLVCANRHEWPAGSCLACCCRWSRLVAVAIANDTRSDSASNSRTGPVVLGGCRCYRRGPGRGRRAHPGMDLVAGNGCMAGRGVVGVPGYRIPVSGSRQSMDRSCRHRQPTASTTTGGETVSSSGGDRTKSCIWVGGMGGTTPNRPTWRILN